METKKEIQGFWSTLRRFDQVISDKCSRHYVKEQLKDQGVIVEDQIDQARKSFNEGIADNLSEI